MAKKILEHLIWCVIDILLSLNQARGRLGADFQSPANIVKLLFEVTFRHQTTHEHIPFDSSFSLHPYFWDFLIKFYSNSQLFSPAALSIDLKTNNSY